jgi:hypothetical protein
LRLLQMVPNHLRQVVGRGETGAYVGWTRSPSICFPRPAAELPLLRYATMGIAGCCPRAAIVGIAAASESPATIWRRLIQ